MKIKSFQPHAYPSTVWQEATWSGYLCHIINDIYGPCNVSSRALVRSSDPSVWWMVICRNKGRWPPGGYQSMSIIPLYYGSLMTFNLWSRIEGRNLLKMKSAAVECKPGPVNGWSNSFCSLIITPIVQFQPANICSVNIKSLGRLAETLKPYKLQCKPPRSLLHGRTTYTRIMLICTNAWNQL